jgi:hypothetical protein
VNLSLRLKIILSMLFLCNLSTIKLIPNAFALTKQSNFENDNPLMRDIKEKEINVHTLCMMNQFLYSFGMLYGFKRLVLWSTLTDHFLLRYFIINRLHITISSIKLFLVVMIHIGRNILIHLFAG